MQWLAHRPGWKPPAGKPLPGYGNTSLSRTAQPDLTATELVKLAYKIHPPLDPTQLPAEEAMVPDFSYREAYLRFWSASPQLQAQHLLRMTAWSRIEEWRALLTAVATVLPPAIHHIDSRSDPYRGTAHCVAILVEESPESPDTSVLMAQLSFVVPLYYTYGIRYTRVGKTGKEEFFYGELPPELAPAFAAIRREIEARYGYRRIDPKDAAIPVPGIHLIGHRYEQDSPTLADALFAGRDC